MASMKAHFFKDNIQRFFAYIFLLVGLVVLFIAIGMTMDSTDEKARESGPSIIVVSFIFTLPGVVLLGFSKKNKKQEEILISLAGLINSYKRISIDKISEKLELSYIDAEKLIAFAIEKRMIKGRIDRTTGEFYTDDSKRQEVKYRFCPNCGSPFDTVFMEGDTIKCSACNSIF